MARHKTIVNSHHEGWMEPQGNVGHRWVI